MRHRAFTILCAVSLGLFVWVCASLAWSWGSEQRLESGWRGPPVVRYFIAAERGRIFIGRGRAFEWPDMSAWSEEQYGRWRDGMEAANARHIFWERWGFAIAWGPFVGHGLSTKGWTIHPGRSAIMHQVMFPHWFAAMVTLVLPGWWMAGYVRERRVRRRVAAGLCVGCGYDLRASRERCPECGRVIEGE